ncbi:hypothetical protein roselon_03009 [Roseibacterium elongatum DSM 19469]|uniref:Uncharacterized protein n=1 Tax=Roseicyclus elongatus DSM 19469 TaxID=1294273 RepID=W8RVH4_9RHOB|nr:hypothetical protein [Roseibacterium elongatum]AHM05288.1 hypothetical protein roselon_03009 [Roseibacterium elongatum DSM 19469]
MRLRRGRPHPKTIAIRRAAQRLARAGFRHAGAPALPHDLPLTVIGVDAGAGGHAGHILFPA